MAKKSGQNREHEEEEEEFDEGFTQSQFDAAVSKARRNARSRANTDLLEAFGVDSLDDLKDLVKNASKKDEEEAEDLKAALEKIAALETENADLKSSASKRDLSSRAQAALEDAGMDSKAAKRSVRLLDLEDGATDEDIADAVDELKEDESISVLFGEDEESEEEEEEKETGKKKKDEEGEKRRPNPARPSKRGKGAPTVQEAARSRLEARHPNVAKKD